MVAKQIGAIGQSMVAWRSTTVGRSMAAAGRIAAVGPSTKAERDIRAERGGLPDHGSGGLGTFTMQRWLGCGATAWRR